MRRAAWALALPILALSAPVLAAPAKDKAPVKPAAPAAPAAPSAEGLAPAAAFAWPSTASVTLDGVLAHFQLYDRELRSLRAGFSQTVTVAETGMTSAVEGEVLYLKPERLRVEYARPERQTVVADGKDIWIHRPANNQVLQSSLAQWREGEALADLLRFGDYAGLLRSYDAELSTPGASGGAAATLRLRPKRADRAGGGEGFELRLELSTGTLFPAAAELDVGGLAVRSRFAAVEFNPSLDPGRFRFAPPEGADVFRDFKLPRLK